MICKQDNRECKDQRCALIGDCREWKITDRPKQCPTTTLPCIKECKEGECALKDPFGIFNKLNERHYAENFINFLLYKGLNLQNGKFYFFKNGLGQAFSADEILDLYMEEKETPAK